MGWASMQDIWAMAFGTAVGFTVAGLLATGYDAFMQRPLGFAMTGAASAPELLLGMLLRVAAGPFLVARAAYHALRDQTAGMVVAAGLVAVACMWGCLSGVIVLDLLGGFAPAATAAR